MHKFICSKIWIERQGEWLFHAGIFYLPQNDRKGRWGVQTKVIRFDIQRAEAGIQITWFVYIDIDINIEYADIGFKPAVS